MTDASDLRVLHVINRLTPSGGAEVSLAQMALLLSRRGVQQGLVTLLPNTAPDALQRLEDAGVQLFDTGGVALRSAVPGLVRAARAFRPHVIASSVYEANRAARLAAVACRTPVVVSIVGTPYAARALASAPSPWKLRTVAALEGVLSRHLTTHVHALTHAVARDVSERYRLPEERITVVPRGRSREHLGWPGAERRHRARALLGLSPHDLMILNVGRQDRPKGQALLVAAFERVMDVEPHARLLIAGRRGAASPELEAAIARSPWQERITLLGLRRDVADLLCAADLFAFSSLWEGLGGSVLEAMGMGVPVVSFDVPAVAEVLGDCGLLVPTGDAQALGDALAQLAADEARRHVLGRRARERFEERYELETVVPRMEALFRDVARMGRARVA